MSGAGVPSPAERAEAERWLRERAPYFGLHREDPAQVYAAVLVRACLADSDRAETAPAESDEDDPDTWSEVDDARKSRDDLIEERNVMRRVWRQERERRKAAARELSAARPAAEPDEPHRRRLGGLDKPEPDGTEDAWPNTHDGLIEAAYGLLCNVDGSVQGWAQSDEWVQAADRWMARYDRVIRAATGPAGDDDAATTETTVQYVVMARRPNGDPQKIAYADRDRAVEIAYSFDPPDGWGPVWVDCITTATTPTVSPWAPVDENGAQT